jgi:hypothetical protein
MMDDQRFICCLKYGTRYSPDYVNVLHAASCKAMKSPFRFICFTDLSEGLHPGIEVYPIPDVGLSPAEWYVGGIWPKLGIFDRQIYGLRGRALFIDLDMIILRDLDDFFECTGPYIGVDGGPGWGRPSVHAAPELCSALISFDLGSLGELADRFRADKVSIMKEFRTEQAFTESFLDGISFWPKDWVISFKRCLRQPLFLDLVKEPRRPPVSAKVLAFHGTPRPIDLIGKGKLFWDAFPHMGHGPVSWMVDYWNANLSA